MKDKYIARHCDMAIPSDMDDLIYRRTKPFLDSVGMNKNLGHLLAEAYLQGMKDAVQTMEK